MTYAIRSPASVDHSVTDMALYPYLGFVLSYDAKTWALMRIDVFGILSLLSVMLEKLVVLAEEGETARGPSWSRAVSVLVLSFS
jgi:hypothetical protein